MTTFRFLLGAAALALSIAGVPAAFAQQAGVLRVSAIPDEAPTELSSSHWRRDTWLYL